MTLAHGKPLSVGLVGGYPPPYGGLSVHVKRLHERLLTAGVDSTVYCQHLPSGAQAATVIPAKTKFTWKRWLLAYGWRCRASVIHFHEGWPWAPAALAMALRGKAVLLTIHDQMVKRKWDAAPLSCRAATHLLRLHPRVTWIAVSVQVMAQLVELGIPQSRVKVVPAFLAPEPSPGGAALLPENVRAFVAGHSPVISTYAWHLELDSSRTDVYGIDMCIEMTRVLKMDYPNLGIAICLPWVHLEDYYQELRRRVEVHDLAGNVIFVTQPLPEAHPLWQVSDLFVRATNTDGDSVSVREALSLRVPVVASDASPRPNGVVLFQTRNVDSLVQAARRVLNDVNYRQAALASVDNEDFFLPLVAQYRQAWGS